MTTATDFEWPKVLRPIRAAAEAGELEPRELYPVEVKALCDLVAGASLDSGPRAVAPGMLLSKRDEYRGEGGLVNPRMQRTAYFFLCHFDNGRVWQSSLYTAWQDEIDLRRDSRAALAPRNIVRALTRSMIERGAK